MLERLIVGCSGSIAIIAIPHLILTLRLAYQTKIVVLLSANARRFITEHAFEALTGQTVALAPEVVGDLISAKVPLLIAPATANTISQLAVGNTQAPIVAAALSARGNILFAPAMNEHMWANPSVQQSIVVLQERGMKMIPPEPGIEVEGFARSRSSMASIDTIIARLIEVT
jgi:phosphopantothenoylcysteine synthetase/decarboxylase